MTGAVNPAITCSHYKRPSRGKRCVHYRDGGQCARSGDAQAACVEWVRVNGGPTIPTPDERTSEASPAPGEPRDRDLFGNPVQPVRRARVAKRVPPVKETSSISTPALPPGTPPKPPLIRNVTDEEIASFKELGAEVCIRSEEVGELWLVPAYTGADRQELSVEHSITLTTICAAFPGAKVVAIDRRKG